MTAALTAAILAVVLLGLLIARMAGGNRTLAQAVTQLDHEIGALKGFLDSYELKRDQVVPVPQNRLSQLIEEITRLGTQTGTDFVAIQSQKAVVRKKDLYQRMPLQISVRSQFRELADFLAALRTLETSTIIITQFAIEKDLENPSLVRGDIRAEVLLKNE